MFVHADAKAPETTAATMDTTTAQRRLDVIFALENPDLMPDARK
jgi:hypothetical protein